MMRVLRSPFGLNSPKEKQNLYYDVEAKIASLGPFKKEAWLPHTALDLACGCSRQPESKCFKIQKIRKPRSGKEEWVHIGCTNRAHRFFRPEMQVVDDMMLSQNLLPTNFRPAIYGKRAAGRPRHHSLQREPS